MGTTHTTNQVPENAKLLDLREVARLTLEEVAERERSCSPSAKFQPAGGLHKDDFSAASSACLLHREGDDVKFSLPRAIVRFLFSFLPEVSGRAVQPDRAKSGPNLLVPAAPPSPLPANS